MTIEPRSFTNREKTDQFLDAIRLLRELFGDAHIEATLDDGSICLSVDWYGDSGVGNNLINQWIDWWCSQPPMQDMFAHLNLL